jgi:prepilin-type processing-associated H-X9-DG protein
MLHLPGGSISQLNLQTWGTRILPYIEQQPLKDRYDDRYPAVNEAASFYPAAAVQQNLDVIKTPLSAFLCPSTPGDGPNRVYNSDLNSAGWPLTWTAAPSDYCASTGVRGDFATLAYASYPGGAGGDREGVLQFNGNNASNPAVVESRSSGIASIRDGTSNTMVVGERVGGGEIYLKGGKPAPSGSPWDDFRKSNGGGWGDFLNGEQWFSGALHDGTLGPDGGPCAINCTNKRGNGYYSFHPGGAQFLMGDGSVRFVGDTVAQFPFAAMITRKKGEAVQLP